MATPRIAAIQGVGQGTDHPKPAATGSAVHSPVHQARRGAKVDAGSAAFLLGFYQLHVSPQETKGLYKIAFGQRVGLLRRLQRSHHTAEAGGGGA